jgi:hypothetical protein
MKHFMKTNPFGFNRYTIEAGKVIGKAPWPLLFVLKGNETYGLEKNCFNMMNLYEFTADEYISIASEQHLQGLFFNFMPLLRKLNLREVLSVRAVIGKINLKNISDLSLPSFMHVPDRPYVELGFGIENIVKIIRLDALWRLSYTKNPDIQIFGLRARFQFML